jgi:tetratricopeptide (TPR) repeat protein
LEYSAVKLFMQSAQRARPGFELHADDLQYIARICRMVHGLPLGILLAASWLEMLSPQEIADEMARSLDFLETEMSDIPTRQRSIRAVFEYSWDLMTPDEQAAFMRLSVFRGGFTREAAQAVANASLRVLMSLLNKSLLRRDPDSGRYSVHDLLGQYAAEQLERSGAAEETHMAHSDYFAAYVHERELPLLGAEQAKVFKEIETEMENIGDAACWAAIRHKWDNIDRSMQALTLYFEMVSRFREGAKMIHELEQLLLENGLPEDHRVLWRVRARKSHVLSRGGEYLEGFKLGEECLAYFERLDDQQEVAYICAIQSYAAMMQGRYADAKAYGKRALDIGMERNYRWEMLGGAFNLGYAHFLAGEYDKAKHIYERILEKAKGFGLPPATTAFASNNLGEVHHALGEETQAKALFEEAHRLFKQINNKYGMAFTCNNLGNVAHACADFQTAQHCNQQALDLYREIGDRRGTGDALNRLGGLTYSLGNYRAAKTYHQEALTIYRAIGDRRGIANSLVMLAMNHNALGEDAECENILLESLALRREMGNPSEVIDSLQLLGLTGGVSGGSLEKSLLYLDEADAMLAQAGASEAQLGGRAPIFRAIIYLYHERFTEALPIFLAALPGAEAVGVWWAVMQVYYGLGCAYVGLANYAEAKTFLRKALNIAKDIRAFDWMVHTFIWGAHIAAQQGRAADAVTWWLFVIDYPACYFPMRELAKRRLTETEAMLSPDAYAAAAARAKTLDLETVTAEVLGILEEARA